MVERQLPKLDARVRFPSPAKLLFIRQLCYICGFKTGNSERKSEQICQNPPTFGPCSMTLKFATFLGQLHPRARAHTRVERSKRSSSHPSALWILRMSSIFLHTHPSRQIFLEFSTRASKPRHNCARGNLGDVDYFLVGEAFLVSQHQDLTKFRGQFIHCFCN